jgi:hypothetical protein
VKDGTPLSYENLLREKCTPGSWVLFPKQIPLGMEMTRLAITLSHLKDSSLSSHVRSVVLRSKLLVSPKMETVSTNQAECNRGILYRYFHSPLNQPRTAPKWCHTVNLAHAQDHLETWTDPILRTSDSRKVNLAVRLPASVSIEFPKFGLTVLKYGNRARLCAE